MSKTYIDFRNAIGFKESSNRYDIVNPLGYMGRYQFGTSRLSDFGLCCRKPGTKGFINEDFEWILPFNENNFLESPHLQDTCFDIHVWRFQEWIQHHYGTSIGKKVNGVLFTMSGGVACCHLLGQGGLNAFFNGHIETDANGVKSTDYITKFGGFESLSSAPSCDIDFLKSLIGNASPATLTNIKLNFWNKCIKFFNDLFD